MQNQDQTPQNGPFRGSPNTGEDMVAYEPLVPGSVFAPRDQGLNQQLTRDPTDDGVLESDFIAEQRTRPPSTTSSSLSQPEMVGVVHPHNEGNRFMYIAGFALILFILLLGGGFAIFSRAGDSVVKAPEIAVSDQSIDLSEVVKSSGDLKELKPQGSDKQIIVNGDFVTTGSVTLYNDNLLGQIKLDKLSTNQAYLLPNSSGTFCLDSNNCGYAPLGNYAQADSVVNSIGGKTGLIGIGGGLSLQGNTLVSAVTPAGITTTLNGISGGVSLQGTANQVQIANSGNVITLTTSQDIATSSSPNFQTISLAAPGTQAGNIICDISNNCGYAGGTNSFIQGGNSFGVSAVLGTNDNNDLVIETTNTARMVIDSDSGHIGLGNYGSNNLEADNCSLYFVLDCSAVINVQEEVTDFSKDTTYGINNELLLSPSSNTTNSIIGSNTAVVTGSGLTNDFNQITGSIAYVGHDGSGEVGHVIGGGFSIANSGDIGVTEGVSSTTLNLLGGSIGTIRGINSYVLNVGDADDIYGVFNRINNTGTADTIVGTYSESLNSGLGVVTDNYGIVVNAGNSVGGSGAIDVNYGIMINTAPLGSGTINDNYGLYIQDQSGVGSNSSYNLYSAGAGYNLLQGHTAIGADAAIDQAGFDVIVPGLGMGTFTEAQNVLTVSQTYTVSPSVSQTVIQGINSHIIADFAINPSATTYMTGLTNQTELAATNSGEVPLIEGLNNQVKLAGSGRVDIVQGISNLVNTNDLTTDISNYIMGLANVVLTPVNANAGGNVLGQYNVVQHYGGIGHDLPSAIAIYAGIQGAATSDIVDAQGVYIASTSGNIQNNYGLYVGDQSGAGSNSSYNIYSAGNGHNWLQGNTAIGLAPPSDSVTLMLDSFPTGSSIGINNWVEGWSVSVPNSTQTGIYNYVRSLGAIDYYSLTGIDNIVRVGGGNTVQISGIRSSVMNDDSAIVQTAYGMYLGSNYNYGTGDIINNYGLYVDDQSVSGSNSSYNIYSAGSGHNLLQGHTAIGSDAIINDVNDITSTGFLDPYFLGSTTGQATLVVKDTFTGDLSDYPLQVGTSNVFDINPSVSSTGVGYILGSSVVAHALSGSYDIPEFIGQSVVAEFDANGFGGFSDVIGQLTTARNNGAADVITLSGSQIYVENNGTGSVATQQGQSIWLVNSGNVTTAVGLDIYGFWNFGSIDTAIGLRIWDQSQVGTTASYNIYSAGAGHNILQGHTAIGANAAVNDTTLINTTETHNSVLTIEEQFTDLTSTDLVSGITNYVQINPVADALAYTFAMDTRLEVHGSSNFGAAVGSWIGASTDAGSSGDGQLVGQVMTTTHNGTGLLAGYFSPGIIGQANNVENNGTSNGVWGHFEQIQNNGTSTGGTGGTVGSYLYISNTGTTNYLLGTNINVNNSGTTDALSGLKVSVTNSGTITSGLSYGIAVTSADTASLHLGSEANSTTQGGGIVFGSSLDTNLYRGAADTLQTDDNFVVNSNLGVNNTTPDNRLNVNTLTTADPNAELAVSTGTSDKKGVVVQGVAGQSENLQEWQDETGGILAYISPAGRLYVHDAYVDGDLKVSGHIMGLNQSGATTIAADANAGAGASVTIGQGSDVAGRITITTGTGSGSGALATVTFSTSYIHPPSVVITAEDANGSTLQYYVSPTDSTFTISSNNIPSDGTTYSFSYHVIEFDNSD